MNKNIVAVLIGLFVLGGVYLYMHTEVQAPGADKEYSQITHGFKGLVSPAEFLEKMNTGEYIVLDVRTPEEYIQQRISKDALSVNFYDTDFSKQLDALDKGQKYLIHCKSGGRSAKVSEIMKGLGFTEFYELKGGIDSWNNAGLDTYSGERENPGLVSIDTEPVAVIPKVTIRNEFPEKVVYGDDMNLDQEVLRLDCSEQGGVFNTCGSVCPKTADICTDQCAFTCEFSESIDIPPSQPVACAMDAKQCPDGSYVGRTGSDCTFVCPVEVSIKEHLPEVVALSSNWWQPKVGTSWQWQLTGKINTSYEADVYDIDLFETSAATIAELHTDGKKVLCYFSAGSYEDWRPDKNQFLEEVLGKELDGWPGERWLDFSAYEKFTSIMTDRLDLAVQKGCDGVEPDNVDGLNNDTGFNFTAADQLAYNTFLANEAHARGLGIALKNNLDQIPALVSLFDMSVNEQCFEYKECDMLTPFIHAGKPVFGVEYELSRSQFCLEAERLQFSWLEMDYALDGGRKSCDDI